ncbi:hypothetical protein BG28_07065 [Nesterenkonia sp. AN1]|uniref:DUF6807 domain-containing protein n=1 Tax=Nesterenkonia sp. AN1 TaxID=652017 RepID=UPI000448D55C|nr:PmoA family protein [Nesterenkonia sp. AN1]EXF24342.1 hypothetical protein BG28_07065 [Nesterenkonia sp. AN1]
MSTDQQHTESAPATPGTPAASAAPANSRSATSAQTGAAHFEVTPGEKEIAVTAAGTEILRYVTHPDSPQEEAPKPYLYPLRFLDGGEASVRRPWDHRWHTGLQFTWSHVADQNFWGGPTFAAEDGYKMRGNLGRMNHTGFSTQPSGGDEVSFDETLEWITSRGEHWFDEHRVQRVHSLDPARGIWAIDLTTELTNVSTGTLPLGSPTTAGRPNAGYTGWFWRGPRSWSGCQVVNSNGAEGEENTMGQVADWVAFSSEHDDLDGGGTIMAFAGTSECAGTQLPPIKWFTRTSIFAVASQSPAFDEEIQLQAGATLRLHHRFVFIARVLTSQERNQIGQEFAL